jgi:hypothetical protein
MGGGRLAQVRRTMAASLLLRRGRSIRSPRRGGRATAAQGYGSNLITDDSILCIAEKGKAEAVTTGVGTQLPKDTHQLRSRLLSRPRSCLLHLRGRAVDRGLSDDLTTPKKKRVH